MIFVDIYLIFQFFIVELATAPSPHCFEKLSLPHSQIFWYKSWLWALYHVLLIYWFTLKHCFMVIHYNTVILLSCSYFCANALSLSLFLKMNIRDFFVVVVGLSIQQIFTQHFNAHEALCYNECSGYRWAQLQACVLAGREFIPQIFPFSDTKCLSIYLIFLTNLKIFVGVLSW